MFDFKFEKKQLLPGLNVVRMKNREAIVGYVLFYNDEKAWTWIRKDSISAQFYHSETDCIEALITSAILKKMDSNADKIGILNNDKFVSGRNDDKELQL